MRASLLYGPEYAARANDAVVAFVMIETAGALQNLDAILDVEGLDGVYIGPSDLSLAMGLTPVPDREEPEFLRVIEDIARRAERKGLVAAMHCAGPAYARRAIDMGFRFVTVIADVRLIVLGAQQAVGDPSQHLQVVAALVAEIVEQEAVRHARLARHVGSRDVAVGAASEELQPDLEQLEAAFVGLEASSNCHVRGLLTTAQ
jgi:hypothetical protein